MNNEYQIKLKPVHHAECLLLYEDIIGSLEIPVEWSAVTENELLGEEPSFGATGDRLRQVITNTQAWANEMGYTLKVYRQDEIGI